MKKTPQISGYGPMYHYYQPKVLGPKTSCEQETQTDEYNFYNTGSPETETMSAIISKLYARVFSLKQQLNESNRNTPSPRSSNFDPEVSMDLSMITPSSNHKNEDNINNTKCNLSTSTSNAADSICVDTDVSDDDEWKPDGYQHNKKIAQQTLKPKDREMVPIGEGHALVPASVLKQMNWSLFRSATNKLLMAVFPRRVLATHSMTGRPSYLLPSRPVKKQLDPKLLNDVVQTVVKRCGVPERVVRSTVSIKLASESQSYCARQNKRKAVF